MKQPQTAARLADAWHALDAARYAYGMAKRPNADATHRKLVLLEAAAHARRAADILEALA